MKKFSSFIMSISGVITFGVIFCGTFDMGFGIYSVIFHNSHLFENPWQYLTPLSYLFPFLMLPTLLYAAGQYRTQGRIWANILGIVCIFVAGPISYSVYLDPSIGMVIGINSICYWLIGLITFIGSLFCKDSAYINPELFGSPSKKNSQK